MEIGHGAFNALRFVHRSFAILYSRQMDMNTSTTHQLSPAYGVAGEAKKSIFRRIFDAWIRSQEARLGPNGVPYLDL